MEEFNRQQDPVALAEMSARIANKTQILENLQNENERLEQVNREKDEIIKEQEMKLTQMREQLEQGLSQLPQESIGKRFLANLLKKNFNA
ncbi:hypothetical protein Hamer_G023317 [Homarus americanus]|uniref:Uncharacterized protein n=1 Tax=Homarus americanus TaxID=6706 RepID=A0A8J5TI89_HOMAM|nr:hypothetical protein Hamer_G023317 [Homarus americanus]